MAGRERSRSPRRVDPKLEVLLGSQAGGLQANSDGAVSTSFELPSPKLGQLLGYKGMTIQKIKEASAVQRLHIHDKEKAKWQPTVLIEVSGQAENVSHCMHLLEALCAGDQTEIGHQTFFLNVESTQIGKLMGHKGQTVKEMTDVTGCYIEIQQYPEQGVTDGQPRLFFAGQQENVEAAVSLAERFIAAPGSRLDAVLGYGAAAVAPAGGHGGHSSSPGLNQPVFVPPPKPPPARGGGGGGDDSGNVLGAVAALIGALSKPSTAAPPGQPSGNSNMLGDHAAVPAEVMTPEPGAPVEERIMEVPARFKGHLLGLHGSTIETIRQTSGVIKCHMQEKREVDRWAPIHVQILGTKECVEACVRLIEGVLIGDHTGIGHSTTIINIDPSVVGKIMGHKGQTIKELTETTGCYIEIQQYPEQGVTDNQPRLFVAGPPQAVENAVGLIERFIAAPGSRLDTVLGPGEHSSSRTASYGSYSSHGGHGSHGSHNSHGSHGGHGTHGGYGSQRSHSSSQQPAQDSGASSSFAGLANALAALAQATTGGGGPPRGGRGTVVPPRNVGTDAASVLAALASLASGVGRPAEPAFDSNAIEERYVEVPTSKKGHLLGLRGQTIETVRQMSGVKKCHMMDKSGQGSWAGTISIQIVGTRQTVDRCVEMINSIAAGDHSCIGHASDALQVDPSKVNTLMGHRGQTVTLLKDLTGCYLDIQQGPQAGVPAGDARVFMAGPPDNVRKAKTVLGAFISLMDTLQVPADGSSGGGAGGLIQLLKGLTG